MNRVSYSRITCFKECRRKYWFQYEEKLEPKGKSGKLLLGSAFDKAAKLYFKNYNNLENIKDLMYNEVTMFYSAEKQTAENKNMSDITEYLVGLREQEDLCKSMIDNFLLELSDVYTSLGIDKVEEISPEYTIKLKNGVEYIFIPDLIVSIKGKIWVVEIKTMANIEFDSLRRDDQARSYVWGLKQVYKEKGDDREIEGIIYLAVRKKKQTAKTKSSMAAKEMFYITERELELWEKDFYSVLNNMRKPTSHYRTPSMNCGWKCSYRSLCNEDMAEIREMEYIIKERGDEDNGHKKDVSD